jgi:hypothetical protein
MKKDRSAFGVSSFVVFKTILARGSCFDKGSFMPNLFSNLDDPKHFQSMFYLLFVFSGAFLSPFGFLFSYLFVVCSILPIATETWFTG